MNDNGARKMRDTSNTDVNIDPGPARKRRRLILSSVVVSLVAGLGVMIPGMASWMGRAAQYG